MHEYLPEICISYGLGGGVVDGLKPVSESNVLFTSIDNVLTIILKATVFSLVENYIYLIFIYHKPNWKKKYKIYYYLYHQIITYNINKN